jgi:hypothetical protein
MRCRAALCKKVDPVALAGKRMGVGVSGQWACARRNATKLRSADARAACPLLDIGRKFKKRVQRGRSEAHGVTNK